MKKNWYRYYPALVRSVSSSERSPEASNDGMPSRVALCVRTFARVESLIVIRGVVVGTGKAQETQDVTVGVTS